MHRAADRPLHFYCFPVCNEKRNGCYFEPRLYYAYISFQKQKKKKERNEKKEKERNEGEREREEYEFSRSKFLHDQDSSEMKVHLQ